MRRILLLAFGLAAAAPASAACVTDVPPGNALRLRAGPSDAEPVIALITRKSCGLSISKCRLGWCEIRRGGMRGWAVKDYLRIARPAKPSVARADPPPATPSKWKLLASLKVDSHNRSDRIDKLGGDTGLSALQLVVKGAAVKVANVRVTDGHDVQKDIPVQQLIEADTSSGRIDLGENRTVKHLELTYGLADASGSAEVQVLGLTASPSAGAQSGSPQAGSTLAQR